LDLDKIEARNTDIMQIYTALQKNNLSMPAGNINLENGDRIFVETNGKIDSIEKLKKLVVAKVADTPLYLEDVADIRY
jgi:multidrug efflux pump subunit AcrB